MNSFRLDAFAAIKHKQKTVFLRKETECQHVSPQSLVAFLHYSLLQTTLYKNVELVLSPFWRSFCPAPFVTPMIKTQRIVWRGKTSTHVSICKCFYPNIIRFRNCVLLNECITGVSQRKYFCVLFSYLRTRNIYEYLLKKKNIMLLEE